MLMLSIVKAMAHLANIGVFSLASPSLLPQWLHSCRKINYLKIKFIVLRK